MAEGEHPEHGGFRLLQSAHDGAIIVECGGRRDVLTLRAVMDGYFAQRGEA